MAGDGWKAEYDDEGYQKRLEAYAAYLLDLREFWPRITRLFVGWMGKQFKSEGAYWNGVPWTPLSPRYAAWKALHYPGRGILVAEGDLRRGSTMLKPSQILSTPRFLVLTVEWPKAPTKHTSRFDPDWHHSGTATVPARPLLQEEYLTPEMQMEVDEEAADYAEEVARMVGL